MEKISPELVGRLKPIILGLAEFIWMGALAWLTILSVFHFWRNSFIATALILALGALMALTVRKKGFVQVYPIALLVGTVVEIIGVQSGAWRYLLPDFFGIPFWLPLVWGNARAIFDERPPPELEV